MKSNTVRARLKRGESCIGTWLMLVGLVGYQQKVASLFRAMERLIICRLKASRRAWFCAWRLVKTAAQLPQRNWRDGSYEAVWHDGDVLRKVKAMTLRESWTQHDPELVEREFLAKEKRRDLAPPKLVKK